MADRAPGPPPRRGVYPGTFNPPTVGHLAIIRAVLDIHRLDRLDLVVSTDPLGKDRAELPTLDDRLRVLEESVAHLPQVGVAVTDLALIADIAEAYDLVVMGADKWAQVNDVRFYRDRAARDDAIARLPEVAVAARGDVPVPPHLLLPLDQDVHQVSSTAARRGADHLMTAAARRFDAHTGAWTDPRRYERFLTSRDRR